MLEALCSQQCFWTKARGHVIMLGVLFQVLVVTAWTWVVLLHSGWRPACYQTSHAVFGMVPPDKVSSAETEEHCFKQWKFKGEDSASSVPTQH